MECETYKYLGHKSKAKPPSDFNKIGFYFIYDVKHDGRYKSRLIEDGHFSDVALSRHYSVVASLKGIVLVLFLTELNVLQSRGNDIGNACLEVKSKKCSHYNERNILNVRGILKSVVFANYLNKHVVI